MLISMTLEQTASLGTAISTTVMVSMNQYCGLVTTPFVSMRRVHIHFYIVIPAPPPLFSHIKQLPQAPDTPSNVADTLEINYWAVKMSWPGLLQGQMLIGLFIDPLVD